MKLNELADNPGATKERMRVGRGIGSGKGKTGGRGVKGQKSRSGVSINGFEGGQMPIYRRLPKRGFTKPNRKEYVVINVGNIQAAVEAGRLDASAPITEDLLVASGILRRKRDGVRLLGRGEVTTALNLEVTGASDTARQAIEKAGGTVTVRAPREDVAEQ
ncbi:50S ribosomal protein L15 [Phaeovibrio sulfidiphilus]|uniref:Large ribosomal subunit protein uL15 n=1 Tax=Phaeovibrio sulfidiphilus TaxID=1220600 RepID=A0A8J6YNN4_9PROT|nr:50S ribosomal protein L15 [Phaeovibrio sulfidiphilus]MBE1236277.1 50S ribosomal protein L15 [Phaeovibrio sulfidiphilus]